MSGLPITAELALYALLVALVIGVLAGCSLAALKPNSPQDYIPMSSRDDWHLFPHIFYWGHCWS